MTWGEAVGRSIETPAIFALRGDLGAGKSVLARAIARGAGVDSPMPSPTFNLLFQYRTGNRTINHIDLYRLEDPEEVWELGWRDLGGDDQVVLIEWPERAEELLPEPRWEIELRSSAHSPMVRQVSLRPVSGPARLPLPERQ